MPTAVGRETAVVGALLAAAAALGLLAGMNQKLAIAAAIGIVFVVRVLDDLMLGVLLMTLLTFVDTLPSGAISPAKLVGALLVVSWLAHVFSHRHEKTLIEERPLFAYLLLLFLGWIALSLLWAESAGDGLTAFTRYAPNVMLIPIVYTAVRSRDSVVRVLAVIAIGAALSAALGIVQPPADPGALGDPTRASGAAGDANELAAALVVGIAMASAFAINRGFSSAVRLVAAAAIPLCLVGLLLTLSRGGLLALGAALIAAVVFSGARFRGRAVAMAIVVCSGALFYFSAVAPPEARDRVVEVGGGTGRIDLWTVGWRMVEAHPLNGVGAGNFPTSSVHYLLRPGVIQRDDFIITKPFVTHNTYLQVLSEMGVVGAAMFLAIIGFSLGAIMLAIREFRRQDDERLELLARGLLIGFIGWLTASFFISQMYSKLFWMLLALGPAMLAVARTRDGAGGSVGSLGPDEH
jgi:O-antigen ligase